MHLYKKIINPKNTAAKITSLLCLISGLFLWIAASAVSIPAIPQACSIILFAAAIYVAGAYLLREYSYEIANNYKEDCTSLKEMYDLIVTERKGNRSIKVCHIELSDITSVRVIDPSNRKKLRNERKQKDRYRYNTQFAASRSVEINATISGREISVLLTFDEELLTSLQKALDFSK